MAREFTQLNIDELLDFMPGRLITEALEKFGDLKIVELTPKNQELFIENIHEYEHDNTLHYIFAAPCIGRIGILPFNFVGGVLPSDRLRNIVRHRKIRIHTVKDFGDNRIISPSIKEMVDLPLSCTLPDGGHIHGELLIGKIKSEGRAITGIPLDEILKILGTIKFSDIYTHFIFYPPC